MRPATPIAVGPLVLLATLGGDAAQAPTFSSRREVVRVDALVTDRGRIVRGLTPADFEVRDNGVLQQVDLVALETLPVDVILALDTSASVSGERLDHLTSAGRSVLDHLTGDDRAALVTFSHVVSLREGLTGDLARVRTAFDTVVPSGETALADGTHAAMLLGSAEVGRKLLIVFSDGLDTASWLSPAGVLQSARRTDVVVYGVVVRGPEKPDFLRDLSAFSGGEVVEVESTRDLSATFLRILEEFRQRYLISYSPSGVAATGWHTLDLRIKGRRATVRARAGYQAGS